MSGQDERLCITTIKASGGVRTMATFLSEIATEAGYLPYLAMNSTNREDDLLFKDIFAGKSGNRLKKIEASDQNGYVIGRIFPELIPLQYILNLSRWREVLQKGDIFFGVSGYNHACLPLALTGKDFGCWIATPFKEDLKGRFEEFSLPKKIAYKASMPFMIYLEKLVYRRANVVFLLSEYTKNWIVKELGINEDKVEVVPYPIDTEKFKPQVSKSGPPSKPYHLIFLGRINDSRKNIPMLLEAFSIIKEQNPEVTLDLVGGEPKEDILETAKGLNVLDNLNSPGRVPNEETIDFYRRANVFVVPSYQEGLCIAALEAMACGTPVVSTKCGGPEDYVEDEVNGKLVENDNPEEMANALLNLLENESKQEEMGRKAREYIEKNNSRKKLSPKFLEAFEKLS